jgi:hypothetical protein
LPQLLLKKDTVAGLCHTKLLEGRQEVVVFVAGAAEFDQGETL